MIRGLIFDFDGLIIDSESIHYQVWQELYLELGCVLPVEKWAKCIGRGPGWQGFDPYIDLEALLGSPVDREFLEREEQRRFVDRAAREQARPGVVEYITGARERGLGLAVASSSSRPSIEGHLSRLDLLHFFDCIKCSGDAPRHKPDPDLYLAALDALGIVAGEAIAFEDSPNGILAAKRAGIFTVAVPNPVTAQLDLSHADLHVASFVDLPLEQLLKQDYRWRQP